MDTHWFNKLLNVLMVQTNSENEKRMVLYLDKELRKLKLSYTIDAAGNVLVTKGKTTLYPCITSHLDTVHKIVDNFKIYTDVDDKDLLFAMSNKKRVGIGGDDKCGVFACLYLLSVIPHLKVVFFSREEVGCKGSGDIDKRFFSDCRYLIQLDRQGKGDFIQTYWGSKTVSHEFASEIGLIKKKYEYKNCTGTTTDVMKLWNNKVGISCINLSCGYYKPHTTYEYISIKDLWNSVKFTEAIINGMQSKKYTSLPPVVKAITATANEYSRCYKCCKWKKDTLLWDVKGKKGKKICYSCKLKIKESNNKDNTKQSDKIDNEEIILFACFECGMTTNQMEKGHSLKYAKDGHMYCNNCMSVLFPSSEGPVKCRACYKVIPKDHYTTIVQGMLVCGVCALELEEALRTQPPNECFVCNKVIPKDHKIIERFGVRVCEDCACPSDIIVNKDSEPYNGGSGPVK